MHSDEDVNQMNYEQNSRIRRPSEARLEIKELFFSNVICCKVIGTS